MRGCVHGKTSVGLVWFPHFLLKILRMHASASAWSGNQTSMAYVTVRRKKVGGGAWRACTDRGNNTQSGGDHV